MNGGSGGSRQLLHTVALLALTGAALAGAALGDEADEETGSASGGVDRAALARLSAEVTPEVAEGVERIRGLEFERVPRARVVDAEFINELGAREARRGGAARGLAVDEAAARLLGLLPPDQGLDAVLESTGDLAAAAYDTRRDRLYLIADAGFDDRTLIEFFLAHELTHALEDQHFGLPETENPSDDAALAELALTEGTATAVMVEYARRHLNPGRLLAATTAIDAGRGDVPAFVVEQLELAYLRGAAFVEELYTLGDGWALVNDALVNRPPASSEQVLHPEAYVRVSAPLQTGIEGAEIERRGWRRLGGGDLGEAATAQLLGVGAPPEAARGAAEGWGGDHYALWARDSSALDCTTDCADRLVLVVRWRWDSREEAREFARALATYVLRGLDAQREHGDTFAVGEGSAAVDRGGDSVTLALAPNAWVSRLAAGSP
jgi:hypothetical protein